MNNRNYINYLFYFMLFIFAMILTVYSPFLTEIAKTYHLDLIESGIVFTANFLGFVLFIFIGGILADRYGKKRILTISLAGLAFSLLLFPWMPNFGFALFAIILIGGFGGIIEGNVSALITDINRDKPSFYLNFAQIFFGIGALIGPIGAGILISSGYSWKFGYLFLGGLTIILTILFAKAEFPVLPATNQITLNSFAKIIIDPRLLLVCLCMALYTGAEVGSWGWMSTFLKQNLNYSATQSSIAVALFWGGMTVGRFICGGLTLRYKLKDIIISLSIISAFVTIISGYLPGGIAISLGITAMGLAYSSLWPLIASFGGNFHQEYSGTVFALLVGCGGIGGTVIPFLMGFIAQNINIQAAMISPSIFFIIVAAIFLNQKSLALTK